MSRTRTVWAKIGVVAIVAATALAVHPLAPAQSQQVVYRSTSQVAPGVQLTKMHTNGPNREWVLDIDPSVAGAIDVTTAHNSLPGFSRTSDMARALHANAAVNGDFGLSPGRPAHLYAEDGELKQTSVLGNSGKNYSTRQDETASYIGTPKPLITVEQVSSRHIFTVENWNDGAPKAAEISGWSDFGGSLDKPTKGLCTAKLQPSAAPNWSTPGEDGVERDYTVNDKHCGSDPLSVSPGSVVIGAPTGGSGANDINGLVKGETVQLTWSLGWPGVTDAMGGSPVLVEDGKIQVGPCGTYLCERQPRTAVGFKPNGHVLLVVIDGRQPGWSVGMTEVEEANFMQDKLGATYAMNMDGGGSSTMWANGKIKNRPSDGSERSVSSAIVVLPNGDDKEPSLRSPIPGSQLIMPTATDTPIASLSPQEAQAAWQAALTDPGSTGGLLDSLAHEGRTPLSPIEQNWLATFRAAQKA